MVALDPDKAARCANPRLRWFLRGIGDQSHGFIDVMKLPGMPFTVILGLAAHPLYDDIGNLDISLLAPLYPDSLLQRIAPRMDVFRCDDADDIGLSLRFCVLYFWSLFQGRFPAMGLSSFDNPKTYQ